MIHGRPHDARGGVRVDDGAPQGAARIGVDLEHRAFPVTFWDIWGELGHPVRTTPSEMGPLLLSRLLGLSEVQEGVLTIAFTVADKDGLLLLDLDDLQSLLVHCGERADDLTLQLLRQVVAGGASATRRDGGAPWARRTIP